jgi:hypothetical protein
MRTRARVDAAYLRGGALPTTDGGRTGRPARPAADGVGVRRRHQPEWRLVAFATTVEALQNLGSAAQSAS